VHPERRSTPWAREEGLYSTSTERLTGDFGLFRSAALQALRDPRPGGRAEQSRLDSPLDCCGSFVRPVSSDGRMLVSLNFPAILTVLESRPPHSERRSSLVSRRAMRHLPIDCRSRRPTTAQVLGAPRSVRTDLFVRRTHDGVHARRHRSSFALRATRSSRRVSKISSSRTSLKRPRVQCAILLPIPGWSFSGHQSIGSCKRPT
jgi:hypothetical protein